MIYEMKVLKEVAENRWDFLLLQTDECYVLNVLFSYSAVDFYRSFKLTANEQLLDFEGLKQLSERIRNNYDAYKSKEITPAISTKT